MKRKSSKGFSLVELLAVLVILALIVLLAISKLKGSMKKSNEKSLLASGQVFVNAVNDAASTSRVTGNFEDSIYVIPDIYDLGIGISGQKPNRGYVTVSNGEVITGCLEYGSESIVIENKELMYEDAVCEYSFTYEYAFKGTEEVFRSMKTGSYKIELWGAQGGNGQSSSSSIGGYGAYSVAIASLSVGDVLYINVGGQGESNASQSGQSNGGYNGGGKGYRAGGGGGATSVSLKSGLLSTLSNDKDKVIMVAGGGGGGAASRYSSTSRGGSGGGYAGENGYKEGGICSGDGGNRCGVAGNQTTGGVNTYGDSSASYKGLFGAGGNAAYFTYGGEGAMGGGGAGYYGGSGTYDPDSDLDSGGGAGGSGYIGSYKLSNRTMYCYGCPASSTDNIKTVTVTCIKDEPTENCVKTGNGYARITLLDT